MDDSNIAGWEPKLLRGIDTCELRVHRDGYVMWHREGGSDFSGCALGGQEGGLQVGLVSGLPYSAFMTSLSAEKDRNLSDRRVLFCGGCLVKRTSSG